MATATESSERRTRLPAGCCRLDAGAEAWRLVVELFMSQRGRAVAMAAQFDLSPMQVRALHQLDPETPVAMSALAGWLACDASNVTGIVDRLEARGLIERRAAPHDRRVKMLAVTERGARVRSETMETLFTAPSPILSLSTVEQRELRDLLRKVLASA